MKRRESERREARHRRWWTSAWLPIILAVLVGFVFYRIGISLLDLAVTDRYGKPIDKLEVVNLARAVKAFDMEYSRLPVPEHSRKDITVETDEAFMAILLGTDGVDLNPRGLIFYAGRQAKDGLAGLLEVDPVLGPRLVDRWGRPYVLILDGDYDHTVIGPDGNKISGGVICYSLGEDGVFDAKDAKSW
jgi:hypothetical protein